MICAPKRPNLKLDPLCNLDIGNANAAYNQLDNKSWVNQVGPLQWGGEESMGYHWLCQHNLFLPKEVLH